MPATFDAASDHNAGNRHRCPMGRSRLPRRQICSPRRFRLRQVEPVPLTPIPATQGPAGNGLPYGYGPPAATSPPSAYSGPSRAPLSGYSNPDSSPSGTPGSPAVTMPGSGPANTYPASPTSPGGMAPPAGGAAPMVPGPGSSSPTGPNPTSAPPGSPPSGTAPSSVPRPGYFPPDGDYRYHDSTQGSSRRGNWVVPSGVAAAPVSLDGATISAPPGTVTQPGVPGTSGLDAGPSVVRIPTGADGGWGATPASAEIPAAPAP